MQHKQILQVLYMIFSCSKQNFSNNAPIFSWWGELLDTCLDNKQLKHTEECTAERGETHLEKQCSCYTISINVVADLKSFKIKGNLP